MEHLHGTAGFTHVMAQPSSNRSTRIPRPSQGPGQLIYGLMQGNLAEGPFTSFEADHAGTCNCPPDGSC